MKNPNNYLMNSVNASISRLNSQVHRTEQEQQALLFLQNFKMMMP